MSKQSSRIYGIKVKEHRNYYEYPHSDDPEIDISEIKIYYDKNAINKWIIKSNYNSIWYNGTAYPVGSIILAFKDGTDCTNKPFMLMAPHEENGIIVNYFYRITGRFSTVPPVEELLIEQEDVPLEPTVDDSDSIRYTIESGHPNVHYDQLYVRKFVNDVEVGHQIVTAESIRAHQVAHSSNYYNYLKVFNALLFDWNGMLPRIEDSYTFTLYSNVTYLEITPTTYQKGWKIKSWNWDTPVNLNILDFSRQPEPAPVDEHDNIKFNVATNENNPDAINIDKVVNNAVVSTKTYSASDILAYRNSHNNEPIVVYENLLLDFYEETYPGYKFYLRANSNYLKYEDNWIKFGDTIISWGYNDIVNFEINDYSNRYENEIKENTTYNVLVEHIVWRDGYYASVDPSVSLTSDDVCYDIFYDHLEMYYNNHYHKAAWLVYDQPSEGYKRIGKLAIMWAKPFWVLITTADGVRWNGTTYKGRKLLRMWHEDEAVDMTMTREQSRKVIAKGQDYNDILYVITTAESSNDLTVIKRINDLDDDTIVFDPETDCPVDFHNIRFTYSGGKIHVYSKCDFIYLSGSNYKKGRDIIDWPLEEKVNFGIKDETNAYEIINTATYTVKSEEVTVTDYDISTLMDEHWTPLKVCKIVNNKESDDEIIYFYDCSINPFIYDGKLEISYDPASTYWTLTSLSDEIYMDNVQYPEGTVIATWPFGSDEHIYGIGHSDISHYDVRLHSVEVDSSASYETTHEYITDPRYFIVTQSDHSLNLTNDQPGSPPVTRNIRYMDALNWYQFFQIKIKYDVTDSDWIIKSDSNELFIGQDRYKKGEIISKWDYYEDVDSTISVLIEDIKHTTREEKVKDLLVSNKSSWLYGYIWQKEEGPTPPPPWSVVYDIIITNERYTYNRYGGYRWYTSVRTVSFDRERIYDMATYGITPNTNIYRNGYLGTAFGFPYFFYTTDHFNNYGYLWYYNGDWLSSYSLPQNQFPVYLHENDFYTLDINSSSSSRGTIYKYSIADKQYNSIQLIDTYDVGIGRDTIFPKYWYTMPKWQEITFDNIFIKDGKLIFINPRINELSENTPTNIITQIVDLENNSRLTITSIVSTIHCNRYPDYQYCSQLQQMLNDEYLLVDGNNQITRFYSDIQDDDYYWVRDHAVYSGATNCLSTSGNPSFEFTENGILYIYSRMKIFSREWIGIYGSYTDTLLEDKGICCFKVNLLEDPVNIEIIENVMDPSFYYNNILPTNTNISTYGRDFMFRDLVYYNDKKYLHIHESSSTEGDERLKIFEFNDEDYSLTLVKTIEYSTEDCLSMRIYNGTRNIYDHYDYLDIYYDRRQCTYSNGRYSVGLFAYFNNDVLWQLFIREYFYQRSTTYCMALKMTAMSNDTNEIHVFLQNPLFVDNPNNFAYLGDIYDD